MIRFDAVVSITDSSAVSEVRRAALSRATSVGFDETAAGRIALVATELATNLIKHGGGGSILLGADDETHQLHLLAIDKGRGIASLPAAMEDGFSTAGSPGTGLGAIRRSTTSLSVFSLPDKGTVISCCILRNGASSPPKPGSPSPVTIAGICLPKPREEVSGDAWGGVSSASDVSVMVADGLGHGFAAATASGAAIRSFHETARSSIEEILRATHGALRPTRGAAVAVARIHGGTGKIEFAGVGNIAASVVDDEGTRRAVSHNGIVGHEIRKVQMFSYPWRPAAMLLMHSDGIGTGWNLDQYPGLRAQSAEVIAGVIYRDFCRGTDDATIVVAKGRG
ncbi:MAG TPA: SpoIIE family protein phosphatase [Thermoanaerobaculia bacterium]|nr:SpoIIE family protein phosphatase [Thermoanaerobaculia bacterium]